MDIEDEEGITAELRELLRNYRNARRASYEPCNNENVAQCLAGLQEDLNLLNIKYVFNPFTELSNGTLSKSALVSFINAVYTLLHEHKRLKEFADTQTENNHVLEKNNAALNKKIERLNYRLERTERDARASIAEGLRAAEASAVAREELRKARAKVHQLTLGLNASQHSLRVTSERAERDQQSLNDKFRDKCGTFLSTSETHKRALKSVFELENTQKQKMEQLSKNNRKLTDQVLSLKRDLLVNDIENVEISP